MWESVDGGGGTGRDGDVSFRRKTCRTQNTEHVHSTLSFIQMQLLFFFVLFSDRVALGYTRHDQSHQIRQTDQSTTSGYMLFMHIDDIMFVQKNTDADYWRSEQVQKTNLSSSFLQ